MIIADLQEISLIMSFMGCSRSTKAHFVQSASESALGWLTRTHFLFTKFESYACEIDIKYKRLVEYTFRHVILNTFCNGANLNFNYYYSFIYVEPSALI